MILDEIEMAEYHWLLLERLLSGLLMVGYYLQETPRSEALHTSFPGALQGQVCQSHRVLGS